MSEAATGERKKHRHDLGQEDHGPMFAGSTTRGIQAVLGMWIALTFILVAWALADASGGRADVGAPAAPPAATAPGS